jgi:DNA-directed RNA polymerase specialized sigma24 family protein/CheY-like chemotaxis protein
MSIAKEIAPQLPYLWRFARALTGSQASGDAFVVSTLEALIADPSSFPRTMSARAALYRVFLSLWASVNVNVAGAGGATASPAVDLHIELLSLKTRQAFLLRTVEGFSVAEVSSILDVSQQDVEELIVEAGREIAHQVATSVLIIEDEPIIALDIEATARDLGHEVIGVARTHREAVSMMRGRRPGLVLADIKLADGSSGLDAVNEILGTIDVPVIFITAYPERLLTGDKPEPTFLITKPFQSEVVKAAISQALFFDRRAQRRVA